MRVLFLTYHYLHGNGGGVFASRAYINAFAACSDAMTLIYPSSKCDISCLFDDKIEFIPVLDERNKIHKGIDLLLGKIHRYKSFFLEYISDNWHKYDLVVLDNGVLGDLSYIIKNFDLKIITIHHNVQIDYHNDNNSGLISHLYAYYLEKNEYSALINSNLNLTLTNADISGLKAKYSLASSIKFHNTGCFEYVNKDNYLLAKGLSSECLRFVISGNLSAVQTIISLNLFIDNYFSIIEKICPSFKIVIAGKNPSKQLIDKLSKYSYVELIQNPENMDDVIKQADVYICPVFLGSGIKLRIMDGLRNGLLVICHTASKRGYENFENIKTLFSYMDEQTFESALRRVLDNEISSDLIMQNYFDQFSFQAGVGRIANILKTL